MIKKIENIKNFMNDFNKNDYIQDYRVRITDTGRPTMLPIGHYALINSETDIISHNPKIAIYGLGSCIALIIYDNKNKIYAMSHILLPYDKKEKENQVQNHPQKYASTAVKDLINKLLKHGAEKKKIRAVIIGGAKIFQDHFNDIGSQNIKRIKQELKSKNIKIIKEDSGGILGRNVIYEPKSNFIYVKTTGENKFERLI